jgi:hypothetical protein
MEGASSFHLPNYLQKPKDHSHYGSEVQLALKHFQDIWKSYFNTTWMEMRQNSIRMDATQAAWDALARARKEETGSGFYLTKQEYDNVNNR